MVAFDFGALYHFEPHPYENVTDFIGDLRNGMLRTQRLGAARKGDIDIVRRCCRSLFDPFQGLIAEDFDLTLDLLAF
jgi:hypothetical protein